MKQETKQCQNCKQEFTIEPDDFDFYEKISSIGGFASGGKVPSPTWCPDCRLKRRIIWRNERSLYKRKCDATGKEIISIYSDDKPFKVYDRDYWWSDNWDPLEYGREYDFTRPFFEQIKELTRQVPWAATMNSNSINSDYCNWVKDLKNCYLVYRSHAMEDCFYVLGSAHGKDLVDVSFTRNSELCYETIDCSNCYRLTFSKTCDGCSNSMLLYDCRNCSNCFGCVAMRSKSYNIFNKQYTKEKYFKKLQELDINSHKSLIKNKQKFEEFKLRFPHKYANIIKSVNVLGDVLKNAKNCKYCFDCFSGIENCKFMIYGTDNVKDTYDATFIGLGAELCYEVLASTSTRSLAGVFILDNQDAFYSMNCHNCSNIFGCVGLRKKHYCIFNKQYSKEEYKKLVPKIIQHMNNMPYIDKKGIIYKYGEFFPIELNLFAYNESVAQDYFPLTKQEAIEHGYSWKETEEKSYKITLKSEDMPDYISNVKDDILEQVIGCEHQCKCNEQCTTAFKITPQEFQFYKKMNIPLPRLCSNCRNYQRFKQRNSVQLWRRKCQCAGAAPNNKVYKNTVEHFHKNNHCPNEFETTYDPKRREIIYCEKCYQSEII